MDKKFAVFLVSCILALGLQSCSNRSADAQLLAKVDSLRRAETARLALQKNRQEAVRQSASPVSGLLMCSLPLTFSEGFIEVLPDFMEVSAADIDSPHLEDQFSTLRALCLPPSQKFYVILVAGDDNKHRRFLYAETFSRETGRMVDWIQIYRNVEGSNNKMNGVNTTEFSITSKYEIYLEHYFSSGDTIQHRFVNAQRYLISSDGHFVEQPIEIG